MWQFKIIIVLPLSSALQSLQSGVLVGIKVKILSPLVPSPPVIKQRECSSCPEAALIRWESGNTNPVDSYTVELREMGADGTESSITE